MPFQETGISEKPIEYGKQYPPGYVLQLRVRCCKGQKKRKETAMKGLLVGTRKQQAHFSKPYFTIALWEA